MSSEFRVSQRGSYGQGRHNVSPKTLTSAERHKEQRDKVKEREMGHWFESLHAVCMHTNTPLKHSGQWPHRNSYGNEAKIVCRMTNGDVPWVEMRRHFKDI